MSKCRRYNYGNSYDRIWFLHSNWKCTETGTQIQDGFSKVLRIIFEKRKEYAGFSGDRDGTFGWEHSTLSGSDNEIGDIYERQYFWKKFTDASAVLYYAIWKGHSWNEWESGNVPEFAKWLWGNPDKSGKRTFRSR